LSLERQTGEQLDVYIVSNDDDPAAFGMFQHTFPHWTCIQSEGNVGFAAGNNQALALIRSKPYEYVWLVNPDVVAPPTYLRDLVEAADAHPDASIMGTYIYFEDKTLWFGGGQTSLENGFQATHQYYGAKAEQAPAAPFECDYITGASLLFRNTLLENADYLPEELFLYFEETQWCMDAHRRGETILIFPTPSLIHKRRSTSNGVPALHYIYYYTRNLILTCQKYNSAKIKTCINTHKTTLALSWINKYERHALEKLLDAKACLNEGIKDGLASVTGYKDINKFLLQHNAESKALSSIQTLK
jgi:GT2 family glycosyltransferase